jgi:hypothetical protein
MIKRLPTGALLLRISPDEQLCGIYLALPPLVCEPR